MLNTLHREAEEALNRRDIDVDDEEAPNGFCPSIELVDVDDKVDENSSASQIATCGHELT